MLAVTASTVLIAASFSRMVATAQMPLSRKEFGVQWESSNSVCTSIILLLVYAAGLLFTLKTHSHIFSRGPAVSPEHPAGVSGVHGGWSVKKSILMLLVASVGIGIGAPAVSWVALGWGEPVLPWWGPSGFVGRPYWGGWGGPRVVNNVVINNTKIVNVTNITRFQNVDVRNAVVGVDRDHFGRGRGEHRRLSEDNARQLQLVRGNLDVKPVAASLVPRVERAQRPPDRIRNRPVVATRPPQDTARRLRAAGISAP